MLASFHIASIISRMNMKNVYTILLFLVLCITAYFVRGVLLRPTMSYEPDGTVVKRLPSIVYYTIQTNIIVIFYLIAVILARVGVKAVERVVYTPAVALPVTIYITVTALVYWLVLLPMMGFEPWFISPSNIWMHGITTIIVIITLLHHVSGATMVHVFGALLYPLAYLIMSLGVARHTGKYTYPFLNPASVGGWGGVVLACLGITGLFIALGWGFIQWMERHPSSVL